MPIFEYQLKIDTNFLVLHIRNILYLASGKGPSWLWLYGSWIYNYLCNQRLAPLMWVQVPLMVSSINNDRHEITEILLKVELNTIILTSASGKTLLGQERDDKFPIWIKIIRNVEDHSCIISIISLVKLAHVGFEEKTEKLNNLMRRDGQGWQN